VRWVRRSREAVTDCETCLRESRHYCGHQQNKTQDGAHLGRWHSTRPVDVPRYGRLESCLLYHSGDDRLRTLFVGTAVCTTLSSRCLRGLGRVPSAVLPASLFVGNSRGGTAAVLPASPFPPPAGTFLLLGRAASR